MITRINAFPLICHLLGWLFFVSLPLIFLLERHHNLGPLVGSPAYLLYCSSFIGLFYLFLYLLIPRLYLRRKQTLFFLAILILFGFFYVLKPFDRLIRTSRRLARPPAASVSAPRPLPAGSVIRPPDRPSFDLVSIYLFFFVLALSMAVRIATEWRSSVRRALVAEADKVSAELSLLKAQIHPHFLFNTLNNIYTLILTGHHGAADSILKLSHIMRYITEDASRHLVPLWQEIKFTEDYLALQRLKLGSGTELDYQV
ncbi:MAG TPA: histidine kinase, partial [Sphingobacteriaceae bacterium]